MVAIPGRHRVGLHRRCLRRSRCYRILRVVGGRRPDSPGICRDLDRLRRGQPTQRAITTSEQQPDSEQICEQSGTWAAFQNQSGLGGGALTSRERKERQISTAVPKGTRSSCMELFRLHHFRGTEIKSQGAMMAEQAVRPDFEITGRADMECGGAFRRRVLYLLAIPRNGPLLILRLN